MYTRNMRKSNGNKEKDKEIKKLDKKNIYDKLNTKRW